MGLQLLSYLVAQAANDPVVEIGRKFEGFVLPVGGDVLPLPA